MSSWSSSLTTSRLLIWCCAVFVVMQVMTARLLSPQRAKNLLSASMMIIQRDSSVVDAPNKSETTLTSSSSLPTNSNHHHDEETSSSDATATSQSAENYRNNSGTVSSSLPLQRAPRSIPEEYLITSSFVVNHIMTTREPEPAGCHRPCGNRFHDNNNNNNNNKIYYLPLPRSGAGLVDRLTIFATLLNMAGYLCARVYVPRPFLMLAAEHNRGRLLDRNMSWSEFGDFTLWNDPQRQHQSGIIDWDNPDNVSAWPEVPPPSHNETYNSTSSTFAPWMSSTLRGHVQQHFSILEEYIHSQHHSRHLYQHGSNRSMTDPNAEPDGFVWVIQADYYRWCSKLSYYLWRRPIPEYFDTEATLVQEPYIFGRPTVYFGCQYGKVSLPLHLQRMRDKVLEQIWEQIKLKFLSMTSWTTATTDDAGGSLRSSTILGYLHIRRQDAKKECNTSLERTEAYLSCSLSGVVSHLVNVNTKSDGSIQKRLMVVLFSSDEDDEEYRLNLKRLIERQGLQQHPASSPSSSSNNTVQVVALDMDELVTRVLRMEIDKGNVPASRLNSFYIFQLIFSIGYNRSHVQFHMERRRDGNCKDCNNVTEQLLLQLG